MGDVFARAEIAGHSTITITQRYVHPQAETVDQVFSRAKDQTGGHKVGRSQSLEKGDPKSVPKRVGAND
jgi:hypothetical protein